LNVSGFTKSLPVFLFNFSFHCSWLLEHSNLDLIALFLHARLYFPDFLSRIKRG
jgi:hypothetical protein